MTVTIIKKTGQSIAQDCLTALKEKAAGRKEELLIVKTMTGQIYKVLKVDTQTSTGNPRLQLQTEEGVTFWSQFGDRENKLYTPVWR